PHGIDEAVAADTNRDGRTDLVVSLDPSITTLIRNAEGDFEPLGPFEIGMRALRLEAHDLDLDGAPEIIAAGRSEPGGLVFARNDGNGAFNEIIQPIGEIEAGGATAVDLNGDGLLDAVVTDGRGNSVIPIIATGDFTYRRESG